MKKSILNRLEAMIEELSPSQRSLANYILVNHRMIPILSSVELANKVGVSDPTVVRLCQKMGFTGYTEFKDELFKEQSQNNSRTPIDRLVNTIQGIEETNSFAAQVFQNELINFKETVAQFEVNSLEDIIDDMVNAEKIFIVGLNSCASLAHFIYFHLNRLGANAEMINSGGLVLYEKLARINKEDIMITISFPRYSVDSLNAIELAKEKRCQVISITDDSHNTIAQNSDHVLVAKSENVLSFYNSFVGAMALCNVLILSYALRNKEKSIKYLKNLTELKESKNLYL